MGRRKAKTKDTFLTRCRRVWDRHDGAAKRRWLGGSVRLGIAGLAVVVAVYGLRRLEQVVQHSAAHQAPARVQLIDVPADLEPIMRESVAPFARVPWSSPTLCADLARVLEQVAWVRKVERVQRYPDRRVEVCCSYRRPFAMVQTGEGFYLVDEDGVRLPGRYTNHPSMKLIQGVASAAPPAGAEWGAPELGAALELVGILSEESFTDQITAVLVGNFRGRTDARAAQIELATDRAGGRIIWGSAPGEEIEENSVSEKLELLRGNYRRFGRVDAGRGVIDVSVHPDRVITPT